MDGKILQTLEKEYNEKRHKAWQEADRRRSEIYKKLPEVMKLDSATVKLAHSLVGSGEKSGEILNAIEEATKRRANLLESAGYPKDYTNPPYECKKCNDSGYVGSNMCSCLKTRIQLEMIKKCGLGKLAETQGFHNFSIELYDLPERERASFNLNSLRTFAENFSGETYENFFIMGGTGLGKTHLSTAVAKTVIMKGYDVVYTTTIRMLDAFEKNRFGGEEFRYVTDTYFDCDLLIIDDLGCEMSTQFTVSSIYDLINTRLNEQKCTIINTNLTANELREKYADRITSRILGNYKTLFFNGQDIRMKKLK